MTNLRRAVLLDRDGVLNRYLPGDYVRNPAMLEILPGAACAVRRFNDAGVPVFVVSNQQGVAKGLMTQVDLDDVDAALRAELVADGAHVAEIYYCTHHKSDSCDCRKPLPGLLLRAAREHDLDLSRSIFVGDTETDAQAGRAAGIGAFVLLLSGKFANNRGAAADTELFPIAPDFVADTLADAADWILAKIAETEP